MRDRPIKFDVKHQVARLRLARNMSDSEAEAIFSSLSESVRSYEQVVEVSTAHWTCKSQRWSKLTRQLLTNLPPHWGGLMAIGHGLLHRWPGVREAAVDLFLNLQYYLVCSRLSTLFVLKTDEGDRTTGRGKHELLSPQDVPSLARAA